MKVVFWSSKTSSKAHEVPQIKLDDNVNMFLKKLSVYLPLKGANENQLYVWRERYVQPSKYVFVTFINNCFKTSSIINRTNFEKNVENYFNFKLKITGAQSVLSKGDAYKLLNEQIKDMIAVTEPIIFKYTNNGFLEYINYNPLRETIDNVSTFAISSYETTTLETLDISLDETLHVISSINFPIEAFFPFKDQTADSPVTLAEFIKSIGKLEDEVSKVDIDQYKDTQYINYFQIKVNEQNLNPKMNLTEIFDSIKLSQDIPYVKYRTRTNVYHKFYKPALLEIKDKLNEWIETKLTLTEASFISNISYKVQYNENTYVTFTIFEDLSYDVKFSFGTKQKESMQNITSFASKTLNKIIDRIQRLYTKALIPIIDINSEEVRIIQIITVNTISVEKKKIKYDKLETVVRTRLFPFFNIINNPDKNLLHLQYKKVDNYTKYDNIQAFIANQFVYDKDVMIKKLIDNFTMTKETAEKEYEKWVTTNEVEISKKADATTFIKPKSNNFINIKIRLDSSAIDVRFIVYGIKNVTISDRITKLIKSLLELSKKKTVTPSKLDNDIYEKLAYDTKTEGVFFKDIMEDDSISNAMSEPGDIIDADLLALEAEFMDDANDGDANSYANANSAIKIVKKEVIDQDKVKGYFLAKLYEADEKLFKYIPPKGKKRKDYASVCQWTSRQQPIALTKDEYEKNQSKYPNALDGYVQTGSTEEKKKNNYYVCPKIWCPISRVALSYDDYNKLGQKCPIDEEDPILMESKNFWQMGEKGLKRGHYPGFLDPFSHHPDKLCLPCCYKVQAKEGSKHKLRQDYCMAKKQPEQEQEQDVAIGNEKYIKSATNFPLEQQRYGMLPKGLSELMGSTVCGPRHDGTGLITEKTKCVLRRGVNQATQSFMSAMINVLDNANIFDTESLMKTLVKALTKDLFIFLENGKILKLFITRDFDIFNKSNFKEFKAWYKGSTLIEKELTKHDAFDRETMIYHKEILREFLIYNSFKSYLDFIKDVSIQKDHYTLLDFITSETDLININAYNILLIEITPDQKFYISCPLNVKVNKSNPFVFIVKTERFYEPMVHISNNVSSHLFTYEQVKNVVDFYLDNCKAPETPSSVILHIESKGLKIKAHVIDYNFRCKGVLLSNNLYIPLHLPLETLEITPSSKFIYLSDVVRYKCKESISEIKKIFSIMNDYTKTKFYDIKSSNDTHIVLNDGFTIVPLNLKRSHIHYSYFENNLDIFIGSEKDDARTVIMRSIQESEQDFTTMFDIITDVIESNTELKLEISFLLDPLNPFPSSFKRDKLMKILRKHTSFEGVKGIEKVTEMILKNQNVKFFILRHKFTVQSQEVLLDHMEIQNNQLTYIIEYQQNPYKVIQEKLDAQLEDYIFKNHEEHKNNLVSEFISNGTLDDVQVRLRKILPKFKVLNVTQYNNNYLYSLFALFGQGQHAFTLKQLVQTYLVDSYEKDDLELFLKNPSVIENLKHISKNVKTYTLDDYLAVFNAVTYYPSIFEMQVLAKVLNISVFVTRRKLKHEKDESNTIQRFILKGNQNRYILLKHSYDREHKHDRLEPYVCDENKIMATRTDLGEAFFSLIIL